MLMKLTKGLQVTIMVLLDWIVNHIFVMDLDWIDNPK